MLAIMALARAPSSTHAKEQQLFTPTTLKTARRRELWQSKSKSRSSCGDPAPDLCRSCPGMTSGSKSGKSGKSGKSSKTSSRSCDEENLDQIACGHTFHKPITLASVLTCDRDTTDNVIAITMSGEDAVLDCAGFWLVQKPADGGDFIIDGDRGSVGIRLKRGATAKNCNVSGFGTGVLMHGGDNTLLDSTVLRSTRNNIATQDHGCMTIAGVKSAGSVTNGDENDSGNGVLVSSTGTLRIRDSEIIGNGSDGIRTKEQAAHLCLTVDGSEIIANEDGLDLDHLGSAEIKRSKFLANSNQGIDVDTDRLVLNIEDSVFSGNADEGIAIDDNCSTCSSVITVGIYGLVELYGNGNDGFYFEDAQQGSLSIYGTLVASANQNNGINLDFDVDFTVTECGLVEACGNGQGNDDKDIEIPPSSVTNDGTIICNEADGTTCTSSPSCPQVDEGYICDANPDKW